MNKKMIFPVNSRFPSFFFSFPILSDFLKIPYKHFFVLQQKNFRAKTMCDMQVIISNSEYQTLKQSERECISLKEKNKQFKDKLWSMQQELKKRNETIQINTKTIKKLSKNALNLSKKIMLNEELLLNQEEKWLLREKQLLEKNMNFLKIKEQMEEGWKREKHALQIKDQKYKQMILKVSSLQDQLSKQLQIYEDALQIKDQKYNSLEDQLNKQRQIYEEALQIKDQKYKQILLKTSSLEDQLNKQLQINEKSQAQLVKALSNFNSKQEQLNSYIEEDKLQKNQLREQIEKMVIKCEDYQLTIDEKDAIIHKMEIQQQITSKTQIEIQQKLRVSLQQQILQYSQKAYSHEQQMKKDELKVSSLQSKLESLQRSRENERKLWEECKKKFREKIVLVMNDLFNCKEQIKEFDINPQQIFQEILELCEKRVSSLLLKVNDQTSKKINRITADFKEENLKLKKQNEQQNLKLKEQNEKIKLSFQSQHKQLMEQKQSLKKTLHQVEQKSLLYNNEKYSSGKLNNMKNQLEEEVKMRKKCQQESTFLKKQNQSLKQTVSILQRKLEQQKRQHIQSEMNSEVIQLREKALYGNKSSFKINNFKSLIDSMFVPLAEYLQEKQTKLKEDDQFKEMANEIVRQEFETILKRFQYLFQKNGFGHK